MQYKEDWEKVKHRFDAFWQGELADRCCISITAPKEIVINSGVENKPAKDLVEKWLDPEFRYNQLIHEISNTYYAGEAFPNFWVNIGPGVISSFIGSPYVLGNNTVWFDHNPIIKDWDKVPDIKFNAESEMWKIVSNMTDYFCKNAENKYFVSMTDLGGSLDIIATLRGTQNLLFDLYDYPDEVKSLTNRMDTIWFNCYEQLHTLANKYLEGMCTWLPIWCRERMYTLQCDFSVMISPSQFEEFVKPTLVKQARFLDKSIYHLDGPGQIPHLEHILAINEINAVEWVPMPKGNYLDTGNEEWYPMYKKIQEKGKGLVLRCMDPNKIEKLLENISSKGLFISTTCNSETEANDLLKKVEKWSMKKGG